MDTNGVELVHLSVNSGDFEDIDDDFQSVRPAKNLSDRHSHNRTGDSQSPRYEDDLASSPPRSHSKGSCNDQPFRHASTFGSASSLSERAAPGHIEFHNHGITQGNKRKSPHENLFMMPEPSVGSCHLNYSPLNGFKIPRSEEDKQGISSFEQSSSLNNAPRKKKHSMLGESISGDCLQNGNGPSPIRSDTMSPEQIYFNSSADTSGSRDFAPTDLRRKSSMTGPVPRSERNSHRHSSSSARKHDKQNRKLSSNSGSTIGRDRTISNRMEFPSLPSNIASSSSNSNDVTTALSDVQSILTDLTNQNNRIPRDLAIKVNELQERFDRIEHQVNRLMHRVDGLEHHQDASFRSIIDEMNKNFARMFREVTEKQQEMIDSNDEVMSRENHVPGGTFGGSRMTKPAKAHSVFHGITSSK